MLEAMKYKKIEKGKSYNFITCGDVDGLSYLKIVLNQYNLDYMMLSTWCMSAEDVLQVQRWWEEGRIKKFDMYVGDIFKNSYKIEYAMCVNFFEKNKDVGGIYCLKNHCKIFAGYNKEENFYFGVQTSANINTNPRIEQGAIVTDKGLFDLYKNFFDDIKIRNGW